MKSVRHHISVLFALVGLTLCCLPSHAQELDSLLQESTDTIGNGSLRETMRSASVEEPGKGRDWSTWRPDPKRALWLAVVLPGAGQIYNRKYWKLPIVYGGFVGCIYAMRWNNMMYQDYSQAYLDIMDNDPTTQSYNQFLHLGRKITTEDDVKRFKEVFRKRKDYYRRYRDLSFFILVGVYALSIIDAYVDASLSDFDISDDLSMHVGPTVINTKERNLPYKSTGVGVRCALTF